MVSFSQGIVKKSRFRRIVHIISINMNWNILAIRQLGFQGILWNGLKMYRCLFLRGCLFLLNLLTFHRLFCRSFFLNNIFPMVHFLLQLKFLNVFLGKNIFSGNWGCSKKIFPKKVYLRFRNWFWFFLNGF